MIKDFMIKERDAISHMIELTKDQYNEVIDFMASVKGRIVFMGVGKSGHIGKKLSATFASLGIPSYFVHSTEAMHGDLGMINCDDVAVLISNSGRTKEVLQNVKPLKNNGVKTIAFTSDENSQLACLCDYKIIYPNDGEADLLGLAPTTSSTLALVLGDAIACELSSKKGFTPNDFHKYHPNGALGEMLSENKDEK